MNSPNNAGKKAFPLPGSMTLKNADIIADFIRKHGYQFAVQHAGSLCITGTQIAEFYERNREMFERAEVAA